MLVSLLAFLFVCSVYGTPPSCAILFAGGDSCGNNTECASRFNTLWLAAAQEEAVRIYHTLDGGFLNDECTRGPLRGTVRVDPLGVDQSTMICIDPWNLPQNCAFKKCNYAAHAELFGDDPVQKPRGGKGRRDEEEECDEDDQKHDSDDQDKSSCRRISSWLEIGICKIIAALDARDAARFDESSSAACVADLIFGRIAERLRSTFDSRELPFINELARDTHSYNHIVGVRRNLMFDTANGNNTDAQVRTVQSIRECSTRAGGAASAAGERIVVLPDNSSAVVEPVSSVLVYSSFDGEPPANVSVAQLAWAITGALPSFDVTVKQVDPTNACVRERAQSDQAEFDEARRFPQLSPQDWVVVLGDGQPRSYIDLQSTVACPLVVLLEDIGDEPAFSVAQLNMLRPVDCAENTTFDAPIVPSLFLRIADDDTCIDVPNVLITTGGGGNGNGTNSSALSVEGTGFRRPLGGVPLTLAPGESRCVGGEKAGALCTMESECGAGWACRRKPFSHESAYCYDGSAWDTTRACAFADADDECPFGECVGDVNGMEGGAYPFLYFFKENKCGDAAPTDARVCQTPHVAEWQQHPNENAFSL